MINQSLSLVIPYIAIGIIIFIVAKFARPRGIGPVVILREFKVDESPSNDVFIDIVGRASGVKGWLLTLIGFSPKASIKVTSKEMSFESSSLSGQIYHIVPLANISSVYCGYSRSILSLILATIFIISPIT